MRKNERDRRGIEIRLLGGLRVLAADGTEVPFPTRKVTALLAVLAADPGVARTRDALAAMLWPRSGEAQARASLRQALAQLRKALAPAEVACVESTGDRVRLDPAGLAIDVIALQGEDAAAAVAAWRGPFLDGFGPLEDPFDEWVRDRRAQLERTALATIDRAVARAREKGRFDDAVALAERSLAIDPTWEPGHRSLIELHVAAGRRGDAVKAWERCRQVLAARLGVEPSDDTRAAYRAVAAGSPVREGSPEGPAAIAVLPFDNLSDDPQQGYFADGIAEDVMTELARFRTLAVTARNSSFAYRGHAKPIREIVAELGVGYVLEGSVRRAGDRVRITAQLIDGRDETHLWADRYDVDAASMFDVQDEITRSVAGALALNIDDARTARSLRRRPEDLAAYDLWLRGMERVRRGSPGDDAAARGLFEQALARDPRFARGWVGISLSHFNDWSCQAWDRWEERERGAFEAARRAVELDEGDHLTHVILGRIYAVRKQYALAEKHFERALALNPNDADCLLQISLGQMLLGRHERSLELAQTAFRRNPRHGDWCDAFMAYPLFMLGRDEEMLGYAERVPDVAVDLPALIAGSHARLGHADDARTWAERFHTDFRRKITFGREPEPGEPVRWIFHVNPWKREEDRRHVRQTLARVGLC